MTQIESAWGKHPGYCIDLVPSGRRARAWAGDLLLAESDTCLRVEETDHVDRLYFPEPDVRFELFEATDHHTICPFKGRADYWSLVAGGRREDNVLWGYPSPFGEVAGIKGYVCFYHERVRVEVEEPWPDGACTHGFPVWGDAAELLRLVDVQPSGEGLFTSAGHRDRSRNVVEGGQLLAEAIAAASKTLPDQRVTSAHMVFSKAASFDTPTEVAVDVTHRGRTFSTVVARIHQDAVLRSSGLLLLDSGAPDLFTHQAAMPAVPGPRDCPPQDMRVTGRQIRVVGGAYSPDPDLVGPPEIHAWIRFRDAPDLQYQHMALLAQSTTHWPIAAAMRPHAGFGEAQAHVTLSTGPMSIALALHDVVDVTDWLLYSVTSTHAGRGLAHGEGHVYTESGRLVASYTLQSMIRAFPQDPASIGVDSSKAM